MRKKVTALLSGILMSAAVCVTASAATDGVMSYEEYIAADVDTLVVVETYVQAKQSWWDDTATVYTQDEDGAYFLYNMECSEEDYELLEVGTKIQVTGYKSEWSGEVEIIDATFEIIDDGDTFIAEALDVTELLGTDELEEHQNEFVTFTGMTVEASEDPDGNEVAFLYAWDGSGSEGDDLYFNVSYNGETYTFVVESYLCDSTTEVYQAVTALEVGDVIDMEGFLYWYEGVNPHITFVGNSDGTKIERSVVESETESETENNEPVFKTFYWGDSKEVVIEVEGEPALSGDMSNRDAEYIAYETTVAGLDCVLAYYFCDEGLYTVRYILTEEHTTYSIYIDDFDKLVSGITSKYGEPILNYDDWVSDSKKEYYTGNEGRALVFGYLTKQAYWSLGDTFIAVVSSADNYDVQTEVQYESLTISPGAADYSSDF